MSQTQIRACLFAIVTSLAMMTTDASVAGDDQVAQGNDAIANLLKKVRQIASAPKESGELVCRSESDAVADKVFRLHTQLMVASLACGPHYGDAESYTKYRLFTRQHAELLRQSRSTLESGFEGDPVKAFDAYRTALANNESSIINGTSSLSYCRMRHARFESLIVQNPDQFPGYARELAVRDRIYKNC